MTAKARKIDRGLQRDDTGTTATCYQDCKGAQAKSPDGCQAGLRRTAGIVSAWVTAQFRVCKNPSKSFDRCGHFADEGGHSLPKTHRKAH